MDMNAFPTLLAALADARRAGNSEAFASAAGALKKLFNAAESRMLYEHAMQYYQVAGSKDPRQKKFQLERAAHAARESRRLATEANDHVGALYAVMIMGGHILPTQERLNEAVLLLRDALKAATALEGLVAKEEISRLQNLVMNLLLHLLDHSITLGGVSVDQVRDWLAQLESNPLFFAEEKRVLYGRIWQKALDYCTPSS